MPSVSPVRAGGEFIEYYSVWDVGASGAMTKKSGHKGLGFASVARTAAGKNTITFQPGVGLGDLVDLQVTIWRAADAESLVARPTDGGFTAPTASAAATALYEIWEIDETAAQVDPANGDTVTLKAVFQKTK